jgi:hypothetical protein
VYFFVPTLDGVPDNSHTGISLLVSFPAASLTC